MGLGLGAISVAYAWVDCDYYTVRNRYDRMAKYIPLFDRVLFLPRDSRRNAVARLDLRPGDNVLDVGCGTGRSLRYLRQAVGPAGGVYGIDISRGMLRQARKLRAANRWDNVELSECDAAEFTAPTPLNGVLFSLSYNTMPHHHAVLRHALSQLRPGGRVVIMDAKLPSGRFGERILPFSLWLMRHTFLGNPLIQPWQHLEQVTDDFEMQSRLFDSYYICRGSKPVAAVGVMADQSTVAMAV